MAKLRHYLDLAQTVYERKEYGEPLPPAGWEMQKWEWGTWYGDGYQGGVFASRQEVIVAFSGTKGNLKTAPISQNTANLRIGLNVIPNMAGSAFAMVGWAKKQAGGKPVSIVGHSLGGALAQVVGNWSGCPFISLNGPGMKTHLKMSAFNIFKPRQMVRSILSKNTSESVGICFSIANDFVGRFGLHIGTYIELPASENSHDINTIWSALCRMKKDTTPWIELPPWQVCDSWPAPE